jgi:hypothetical protein
LEVNTGFEKAQEQLCLNLQIIIEVAAVHVGEDFQIQRLIGDLSEAQRDPGSIDHGVLLENLRDRVHHGLHLRGREVAA